MKSPLKSVFLSLLLAASVILTQGCGGSSSSSGGSASGSSASGGIAGGGGGGGGGGTGNVTFQFIRAQAGTVPLATGLLGFNFYNNVVPANGDIVLSTQAAFGSPLTIQDVPTAAQSVVIRALDINTNPLLQITQAISVTAQQTTVVDLSGNTGNIINYAGLTVGPDPLTLSATSGPVQLTLTGNFDDGSQVQFAQSTFPTMATFNSNSGTVAVDGNGLATATGNGAAGTITANYTIDSVTRTDTVNFSFSSLVVTPATMAVNAGVPSAQVLATFFNGSAVGSNVTEIPSTTYAISPPVAGFTANTNGRVSVAAGVTSGTTATLLVTHVSNGNTFTDTVALTVN